MNELTPREFEEIIELIRMDDSQNKRSYFDNEW
jgi:hypothetical protein